MLQEERLWWKKIRNEVTREDSKRVEVLNGDFKNVLAQGSTENIASKIMLVVSLLMLINLG